MAEKYLTISLDDERSSAIADVLSNSTCKKILNYLAENEASETEIARDLNLAANTVNYNVKKLLKSGLIKSSKNWVWSVKGKKILRYKISQKKILISPTNNSSSINVISTVLATGIIGMLISYFFKTNVSSIVRSDYALEYGVTTADKIAPEISNNVSNIFSVTGNIGMWFVLGGLFALIIFMILNWRRL